MARLMRERWRQDRVPLLLYLLTFIAMSYPFILRMHDSLMINNVDTHTALWQNWWMREALGQGNVNHSQLLFYPEGLDVTLQPRRWATFPLWNMLYAFFGDPLAFNLTAMLGILFKAYGMYLVGLTLFKKRIPAWVSGAFYAFASQALALALQQPNTGATEWIPWFMLAFLAGLSQIRARKSTRSALLLMVAAGLLFSLNAYVNLKIAIFAMLLGGGYVLLYMIAHRLWASRLFWTAMFTCGASALAFSLPLLSAVLQSDNLQIAVSDDVRALENDVVDILSYAKAALSHPLTYTQSIASLGDEQLEMRYMSQGLSHVGIVSMVFALMGTMYAFRVKRGAVIWVVLAAVFWLLSLGVNIYFNNSHVEGLYWSPYRLLQDNLIFRTLKWPYRMELVFLFPYSLLIGYGLHYRLGSLVLDRAQWLLLTVSVVMLLYGASIFPIPTRPAPRPSYVSALSDLPSGAVIDVPFGRQSSKYYMSVQRFHGRPIVEGMIARVPPGAYDYINSNLLLSALHDPSAVDEQVLTAEDWRRSFAQLVEDGFRYLILHRQVPVSLSAIKYPASWVFDAFPLELPVYQDGEVLIYDLAGFDLSLPIFYDGVEFSYAPARDGLVIHVGDVFRLHLWTLAGSVDVGACDEVVIESWWQMDHVDAVPYTLSVILSDGSGQVSIADAVPADKFTTEWRPGRYYRDRTSLLIPCDLAGGRYDLLLGMKESMSGKSLPFRYADDGEIGSLYYLTTLNVQEN